MLKFYPVSFMNITVFTRHTTLYFLINSSHVLASDTHKVVYTTCISWLHKLIECPRKKVILFALMLYLYNIAICYCSCMTLLMIFTSPPPFLPHLGLKSEIKLLASIINAIMCSLLYSNNMSYRSTSSHG